MKEQVSTYTGKDIEIVYDRRLCIHAAECGRGSRALFNVEKDPWCDPDAVSADVAAAVVERCPTGALRYKRLDDGGEDTVVDFNSVMVSPDGPLYVKGDLDLQNINNPFQHIQSKVALCRCGASSNKPFCDGSHGKAGFKDSGAIASDCTAESQNPASLKIKGLKNGPLVFEGPVTIHAASGRKAFCGDKTALCRCGASNNKPFCDGRHMAINFETG